jgi:hypothetical protein
MSKRSEQMTERGGVVLIKSGEKEVVLLKSQNIFRR